MCTNTLESSVEFWHNVTVHHLFDCGQVYGTDQRVIRDEDPADGFLCERDIAIYAVIEYSREMFREAKRELYYHCLELET